MGQSARTDDWSSSMRRENVSDLLAFLAVARERSFTKAGKKLGISQSALSHTIRGLEERLGLRLLTRTTRSVSPTEAGDRLLASVGSRFEEIEAELEALSELRDKPAGTIRITATEYAADTILWPKLAEFLPEYPDVKVEINVDYGLTDIVAQRFDAGVRSGEQVAKDMIAVRIGPDMRMAVVGTPSYFAQRSPPEQPQDLTDHNCINLRLQTYGGLYAWEFETGVRQLKRPAHPQRHHADAQCGAGRIRLALSAGGLVKPHLDKEILKRVLEDWCIPFSGYHFLLPEPAPAFSRVCAAGRRAALSELTRRGGRAGKAFCQRLIDQIASGIRAISLSSVIG